MCQGREDEADPGPAVTQHQVGRENINLRCIKSRQLEGEYCVAGRLGFLLLSESRTSSGSGHRILAFEDREIFWARKQPV